MIVVVIVIVGDVSPAATLHALFGLIYHVMVALVFLDYILMCIYRYIYIYRERENIERER